MLPPREQALMALQTVGVPHDLEAALELYPCRHDKIDHLLSKRRQWWPSVPKVSGVEAVRYICEGGSYPSARRDTAIRRLRHVNSTDPIYDRLFEAISPPAIAIAIFHDLDTVFFHNSVAPHVRLEVNCPETGDAYGHTEAARSGERVRICLGLKHNRGLYQQGNTHKAVTQHLIKCVCHEMVHAYLFLYVDRREFDSFPRMEDEAHNLLFSRVIRSVQRDMHRAGWYVDLMDSGRFVDENWGRTGVRIR